MNEDKKQRVVCYLKVNQKDDPLFIYVKQLERYCHDENDKNDENYEIVGWYIDVIEEHKVVNPALIRLMNDVTTQHNFCDVILTFNKNQLSITEHGVQSCENIFKSTGIKWVKVENGNSKVGWSSSIIDLAKDSLLKSTSITLDKLEKGINDIKEELYIE